MPNPTVTTSTKAVCGECSTYQGRIWVFHFQGQGGVRVRLCDRCLLGLGRQVKAQYEAAQTPPWEEPRKTKGERYVPTMLRPSEQPARPGEVAYACGYEDGLGAYGFWAGPFPGKEGLGQALEEIPQDNPRPPVIVKFCKDGANRVLYRWNDGAWVRV